MKTKDIELKEEKLNNIYEQFKLIYGFNKLFPNLENKKIIELSYLNDIKNHINRNINDINCKYKIVLINFDNIPMKEGFNNIIDNIINFILKNFKNQINNIEILSFININLVSDIDNNNIIKLNNNFDNLPNLKEFFINNIDSILPNYFSEKKLFDKFEYIYIGYDEKDNCRFYRNGKNKIQSIDILDLFNLFNNNIVKLNLKYENIDIIFNSDKSILKIINLKNNNDKILDDNNTYNYPLSYLSDFIKNQNTFNDLIIEGFDFTFDEIQNKNIKKLSINYNEHNKLVNYNINKSNNNLFMLDKDINLKIKFPQLEEINIGNIKNENILFVNLFINENFCNNLKNINIITFHNYKFLKINKNKIKTNIISKRNIKLESPKELEVEEENEDYYEDYDEDYDDIDENEDLFIDEYQDLLDDENPVVTQNAKRKKRKNKNDEQKKEDNENKEIILIKEKILPYKTVEENLFKKDIKSFLEKENILYFNSNIIKTVNNFYLIYQSLLLINNKINIKTIKFNLLSRTDNDTNKLNEYKNTKNLFIIFITENSKIFCIYLKNENLNEKGDDFFLDLNNGDIYYHIKEEEKRKKSKNEISREKTTISRKKFLENKYQKLYYYFFDKNDMNFGVEELFEIYQIIF